MTFIETGPQAAAFICMCLCILIIVIVATITITDLLKVREESRWEMSPEVIAEFAKQARIDRAEGDVPYSEQRRRDIEMGKSG